MSRVIYTVVKTPFAGSRMNIDNIAPEYIAFNIIGDDLLLNFGTKFQR